MVFFRRPPPKKKGLLGFGEVTTISRPDRRSRGTVGSTEVALLASTAPQIGHWGAKTGEVRYGEGVWLGELSEMWLGVWLGFG